MRSALSLSSVCNKDCKLCLSGIKLNSNSFHVLLKLKYLSSSIKKVYTDISALREETGFYKESFLLNSTTKYNILKTKLYES